MRVEHYVEIREIRVTRHREIGKQKEILPFSRILRELAKKLPCYVSRASHSRDIAHCYDVSAGICR